MAARPPIPAAPAPMRSDLQLHRGAGQNTSSLAATAVNLNGATITDGSGDRRDMSLTGLTQTGPQIDTVTPAIDVAGGIAGDAAIFDAASTVTLTFEHERGSDPSGGTPTLSLNDGGTATYSGGSGTQRADLQLHGCDRAEHVGTGSNAQSISTAPLFKTLAAMPRACRSTGLTQTGTADHHYDTDDGIFGGGVE